MKKVYLIGSNVEGVSKSKPMHDAFGLYDYELKNVSTAELESFIKTTPFDGLNVTIPHKKAIMAFLDEISPEAREIGAVNVVVKKDGRLLGYNTDIYGIEYAFSCHNATVKDKSCLILGTGGTSNTAAYFCKKHGAKYIAKASRTPKLENNIAELSNKVLDTNSLSSHQNIDKLFTTTSQNTISNLDQTLTKIEDINGISAKTPYSVTVGANFTVISDKNSQNTLSNLDQTLTKIEEIDCVPAFFDELSYSQAYEKDFDVIINTTPVGMTPNTDETPIEIARFTAVTALFDAIYTPEETKLVKEAKAQNINAFGGIEMLAAQGKYAAELFTDTQLSNTLITTALKAIKD